MSDLLRTDARMLRVVIYARVSTDEQREKDTIQIQLQAIRAYIAAFPDKYKLVGEYLDEGVSGTIKFEERPKGKELMDAARRGEFDHVIVYKIDRFGRKVIVILNVAEALKEMGISFASLREEVNTASAFGQAFFNLLAVFAQLERDMIIDRTTAGREIAVIKNGKFPGAVAPLGYYKDENGKLQFSTELIPGTNISEYELILKMFYFSGVEKRTNYWIAQWCNTNNIPTACYREDRAARRRKDGNDIIWAPQTVSGILQNKTYMGVYEYGKRRKNAQGKWEAGEIRTTECPAIVSKELWEASRQTREDNWTNSPRNAKHTYLLSGMIRCGCGRLFIGQYVNTTNKRYYCCGRKWDTADPHGCSTRRIRADRIEEVIWARIREWAQNPVKAIEAAAAQSRQVAQNIDVMQEELDTLTRQVAAKKKKADDWMSMFRKDLITYEDCERNLSLDAVEIRAWQERITELEGLLRTSGTQAQNLGMLEGYLKVVQEWMDSDPPVEDKRMFLRFLIGGITVGFEDAVQVVKVDFVFDGAYILNNKALTKRGNAPLPEALANGAIARVTS